MYIAIDFDGTCVAHDFPRIGADIGAVPVLRKLVDAGHQLILFTMRSDKKDVRTDDYNIHGQSGDYLSQAVDWFRKHELPLTGINVNPRQSSWTNSPKAYAQLYIDDAALGIPLKEDPAISKRPFVDWEAVEKMLVAKGILTNRNVLNYYSDENYMRAV
jgi:hypothetical protein